MKDTETEFTRTGEMPVTRDRTWRKMFNDIFNGLEETFDAFEVEYINAEIAEGGSGAVYKWRVEGKVLE